MRGTLVVLLIALLYAGLGTFIAGMLFPDEDDVWVVGIFWPLMVLFVTPIWVIHTCEIMGKTIGDGLRWLFRKGDRHD